MVDSQPIEIYPTTDTPEAAYLIQAGFPLIRIEYDIGKNGKTKGTYLFHETAQLLECVRVYNQGDAVINLARYEHVKSSLLDRIMGRLP
jgi:hypothetical protein